MEKCEYFLKFLGDIFKITLRYPFLLGFLDYLFLGRN